MILVLGLASSFFFSSLSALHDSWDSETARSLHRHAAAVPAQDQEVVERKAGKCSLTVVTMIIDAVKEVKSNQRTVERERERYIYILIVIITIAMK